MNSPIPGDKQNDRATSRGAWIALVAVMTFAATVRVWTIQLPFHRGLEGLGAYYGILARNYFRHDFSTTHGVPVQSIGLTENAPVFYHHHPPLVPMFIAATYWVFDDPFLADYVPPEGLTRLPATVFTLGCVVTIFALMRNRAGPRAAIFSAALFAATPMVIYYGGHADVINSQLVFFVLLSIGAYLHFHAAPSASRLAMLCAAFLPAGWTDWPAYYLCVVLGLHYVFTKPWKSWGWIVAFGIFSAAVFMAAYAQIYSVRHDWKWIVNLVQRRAVQHQTDASEAFTWKQWLSGALVHHNDIRHTRYICAMALIGGIVTLSRRGRGGQLARLALAWAALHIVIGRQGVYQHEWWWWPLTPALAILAGMGLDWICAQLELRRASHGLCTAAATVAIIALSAWTTHDTLRQFRDNSWMGAPHYSVKQMADAIRSAAPANTSVALADSDDSIPLWYYADRPIIRNVWDMQTLDRLLDSPSNASLPWHMNEHWPHPPAAMIFPKAYLTTPTLIDFANEVRDRYESREDELFLIINLMRRYQKGPASKETGPDAD